MPTHTYGRGGALACLAAYDVHSAKVFDGTEPHTGIGPFMNWSPRSRSGFEDRNNATTQPLDDLVARLDRTPPITLEEPSFRLAA